MITLTDRAADRLKTLVDKKNTPAPAREEGRWTGLRLFVQGGGCAGLQYGMTFERTAREGDTLVDAQGVRLYVDPVSAAYLKGASIDCEDSLGGSTFRVDNPNAVTVCACGSSFRT
jgi:iron-sulfur cluster assembly accessory protein